MSHRVTWTFADWVRHPSHPTQYCVSCSILDNFIWLAVEKLKPLWKILVKWDDYSQYMEKYNMFHTTNQYQLYYFRVDVLYGSRNRSSHSATQPLCQSGWGSHSATLSDWVAEWLSGCRICPGTTNPVDRSARFTTQTYFFLGLGECGQRTMLDFFVVLLHF